MILPMLSMAYRVAVLVIGLLPREAMCKLALLFLTVAFLLQRMFTRPVTGLVYFVTVKSLMDLGMKYDLRGFLGLEDDEALFHPIATPLTLLIVWAATSAFVESVQDSVGAQIKALARCVLNGLVAIVAATATLIVKALTWVLIAVPSKIAATVAGIALQVLPARVYIPVARFCNVLLLPFNAVANVASKIQANAQATANTLVEELHIPERVLTHVRSFFAVDAAPAGPEVAAAEAADDVAAAAAADVVAEAAEVSGVEVNNNNNNNNNNAEEEEAAAASVAARVVPLLQAVEIRQPPPHVVEWLPPRLPPPPPDGGGRCTLPRASADLPTTIPGDAPPRGALPAFGPAGGHPTNISSNSHQESLAAYTASLDTAAAANSSRTGDNMNGLGIFSGLQAPTTNMAVHTATNQYIIGATNGPSASSSAPTIPTSPPPAAFGITDSVQPPQQQQPSSNDGSNANEATVDIDDDIASSCSSCSSSSSFRSGVLPAGSHIKKEQSAASTKAGNKRKFDDECRGSGKNNSPSCDGTATVVPGSVLATDEESSAAEGEGESVNNEDSEPPSKRQRKSFSASASTAAASAPKSNPKKKKSPRTSSSSSSSSSAPPKRSCNGRASTAAVADKKRSSKSAAAKTEEGDSSKKEKSPRASTAATASTKRRGTAAVPAASSSKPAPPTSAPSKRNRAEIRAAAKRCYAEQLQSEQAVNVDAQEQQEPPNKKVRRTYERSC